MLLCSTGKVQCLGGSKGNGCPIGGFDVRPYDRRNLLSRGVHRSLGVQGAATCKWLPTRLPRGPSDWSAITWSPMAGRWFASRVKRTIAVTAGDILIIPHGDAHTVSNGSPTTFLDSGTSLGKFLAGDLTTMRLGGGGEKTAFVCGYFGCERHADKLFPRGPAADDKDQCPW